MPSLLTTMLTRGDQVAILNGRLIITPASGREVPTSWLIHSRQQLLTEIAESTGVHILEYLGYSTGNYGPHKAGGVTLQFANLSTGEESYAIFNVGLKRLRDSKHTRAGTALPARQFTPGKRSAFIKFWLSTKLTMPNRLGKFHQHMGTLKNLLYTGTINTDNNRIEATSLKPANIPANWIKAAVLRDNRGTQKGQAQGTMKCSEAMYFNALSRI